MKYLYMLAAMLVILTLAACQPQAEPGDKAAAIPAKPAAQATPECLVEPPAEPVACTMEWRPVCGCDGKTYSNGCMAKAAGVTQVEEGECDKSDLR